MNNINLQVSREEQQLILKLREERKNKLTPRLFSSFSDEEKDNFIFDLYNQAIHIFTFVKENGRDVDLRNSKNIIFEKVLRMLGDDIYKEYFEGL